MRMTEKKIELAHEMARYIIEFEQDDFFYYDDEPSKHHVYFKAVSFAYGEQEALRQLREAKKNLG